MSEKIVQLNEEIIKSELKELVRSSVEETLNNLLEQEANELTNAAKYERTDSNRVKEPSPVTIGIPGKDGRALHVPKVGQFIGKVILVLGAGSV